MRIERVLRVTPEPEKPPARPPTRRAFLLGVCAGSLVGAAGGWFGAGLAATPPKAGTPSEDRSADEQLRWALALQEGPLDELARSNTDFLLVFTDRPETRDRLSLGLQRLSEAVVEDDPIVADQRTLLAAKLAQAIEASPPTSSARTWLPALRRVRR